MKKTSLKLDFLREGAQGLPKFSYSAKTDFDTKNAPTLKNCISALDANFSTIFADSESS